VQYIADANYNNEVITSILRMNIQIWTLKVRARVRDKNWKDYGRESV
jgi:hypothetical protein